MDILVWIKSTFYSNLVTGLDQSCLKVWLVESVCTKDLMQKTSLTFFSPNWKYQQLTHFYSHLFDCNFISTLSLFWLCFSFSLICHFHCWKFQLNSPFYCNSVAPPSLTKCKTKFLFLMRLFSLSLPCFKIFFLPFYLKLVAFKLDRFYSFW